MNKRPPVVGWEQVPVVVDLPYVAIILGVNPELIRRLIASGELKGFKVGREWRIAKSDLMRFVGEEEKEESA